MLESACFGFLKNLAHDAFARVNNTELLVLWNDGVVTGRRVRRSFPPPWKPFVAVIGQVMIKENYLSITVCNSPERLFNGKALLERNSYVFKSERLSFTNSIFFGDIL